MPDEILTADADITDGGWLTDTGGATLFAAIDEVTASDTDYIVSGAPDTDACEIALANPAATMGMPFSVAFRYKRIGSDTMTLRVQLMQGTTSRASWDVSVSNDTFTDVEQFLTAPEFAAITDFTDLRVRLTAIRPPPYEGPGNVVSGAVRWWGLRAYSAANIGTNIIRLRRSGDNAESDFAAVSGGGLDLAAIATFKGANNLFVTTLYDQGTGTPIAGNPRENAVQTTAADQPAFILSGIGSLPVMRHSSSAEYLDQASVTVVAQPFTLASAAIRTAGFTSLNTIVYDTGFGNAMGYHNSANTTRLGNGGGGAFNALSTASDSVWHSMIGILNAASSIIYVDASGTSTAAPDGNNFQGRGTIGAAAGGDPMQGDIVEVGLWPTGFSAGQASAMSANQHAYWGF